MLGLALLQKKEFAVGVRELEKKSDEKWSLDSTGKVRKEGSSSFGHLISLSEKLEALNLVFEKAAEDDTPTEIPDYLCCNITLEIFRDPVITPSGFTYERAVILNHLQKVGNFDPITRDPVNTCQLVPNLAIKEAVRAYLAKHRWAYKAE
ncbi:unnamed protein product [Cuscuta campestris]|uniref:RING-type E3 ubiquitin transferase n=1 Tax=Cuscuta campestris TaxID=132261 RepID=A0A484MC31_9ASTE|nr:unnamed protein product [Cuscuta campestris]